MSKVPPYQNKNNKSFSPNIRIWLYSVLQLLQLFNKNCCKGAAIFGVPLLWLCTTAVTHIIIIIIRVSKSIKHPSTSENKTYQPPLDSGLATLTPDVRPVNQGSSIPPSAAQIMVRNTSSNSL